MKLRHLLWIILLLVAASAAHAQVSNPPIIPNTTPPVSCTTGFLPLWMDSSGNLYTCQAGVPTAVGGAAGCPTCVLAVSPGTGIAHFAGSTQAVTSSPVNLAGGATEVTGVLPAANLPVPTISATAGDTACAVANDLTIGQRTITGGSSTASTITVTGAVGFNFGYYAGEKINVQSVSPGGYNGTNLVVTAVSAGSVTYTSANNPGAWSSGGTISKYCSNQSNDAIAATPYSFVNTFTAPANWVQAGSFADLQAQLLVYTPASNAAGITGIRLVYAGNTLYQNKTALTMDTGSVAPYGAMMSWSLNGLNTTSAITNLRSVVFPATPQDPFTNSNAIVQPFTTLATASATIGPQIWWTATGVASGTYTSGGSISGSTSQTCTLATFATCTGTTGTVALTSTNTIAGGTALVITARGAACTSATTATLGSGTATCSGTATIATTLGGAPGNAVELVTFTVKQN